MRRTTALGIVAATWLALGAHVALAGNVGEYTFAVLRDGDRIGTHRVLFHRDGPRIEIEAATEIEVRFAMIPVYRFEHQRREIWENGRALMVRAKTNQDGDSYDITVQPSGRGYIRTVNGRVDRFDDLTQVLAFWNIDTLKHRSFFSVIEDKTFDVSFHYLGRERMMLAGQPLEVNHYRMVGDENRDLWYDPAGQVAKVQFQRQGSDIVYLRDQVQPRRPGGLQ